MPACPVPPAAQSTGSLHTAIPVRPFLIFPYRFRQAHRPQLNLAYDSQNTRGGAEYNLVNAKPAVEKNVNSIPGDFNGDGNTDPIRQERGEWDDNWPHTFKVLLSMGNRYFSVIEPSDSMFPLYRGYDDGSRVIPLDYNGTVDWGRVGIEATLCGVMRRLISFGIAGN